MVVERAVKPEEGKIKLSDFSAEEQNFYWLFYFSYRFSQGGSGLQSNILKWLELQGFLDNLHKELPDVLKLIKAPKQHKYQDKNSILTDLSVSYSNLLFSGVPVREIDKERLLINILLGMVNRDIEYQNKKRPGRWLHPIKEITDSNYDTSASFVRRHAICDAPTGHPVFDQLFNELSEILSKSIRSKDPASEELNMRIRSLQRLWELNHPVELFFPQNFIDGHTSKNFRD